MYSATEKQNINDKTKEAASDIRDGMRNVRDDVKHAATDVKRDLEGLARQAGSQARDFVGTAEANVYGAADAVSERIRDNPVQSSVIGLAVGVLLGMLFARR